MRDALSSVITDALTALAGALHQANAGVVEQALARSLHDDESLALLHRLAGAGRRIGLVGDGVVFVGAGVAVDLDTSGRADDVAAALAVAVARAPRRRFAVTLPFAPAVRVSATDASWRRLRTNTLWAPRLSLHQHADAPPALVVDLGDPRSDQDLAAARIDALALMAMLREPAPSSRPRAGALQALTTTPDQQQHADLVADLTDAIKAASFDKIVLARRRRLTFDAAVPVDIGDHLVGQLQPRVEAEVRFLVADGGDAFVGCTPERLCRRRGRLVQVDVLAGTSSSSPSSGDGGLLNDDKERREHEAVRRMVHDALAPVAVRVSAPSMPVLRRLQHVQHLLTPVSAELIEHAPVFHRLHPTPAVAGVPTAVAVARIAAVEGFDRGLYSGAIGVAMSTGEDLYVGLRCAHLHDNVIDLYVGSGLVDGSEAEREWAELERKERVMGEALGTVLGVVVGEGLGAGVRRGAA
jgi:menaquinone-specific isochorismate synthase